VTDRGLRPPGGELAGGRDETIEPTGDVTRLFNAAHPAAGEADDAYDADEGPPSALTAEWALWGKDERQTAYHVLRCSDGELAADDFREIITRYGLGVQPDLPQYTVCWIPGPHGRPEHIAVGIHELADPDPRLSGGRSRHVGGRVVEYVRLFCVRYADLADLAPTYAELVAAVTGRQLPDGDATPLSIELPPADQAAVPGGTQPELAAEVAVLLLTGRPVCILNADQVPVAGRLAFIDGVLSLLPYGLRAALSASTWASSNAQDLKFRLFFASAPRDDGGRTIHLAWDQWHQTKLEPGRYEAADLYQDWLHRAGPGAIAALSSMGTPVRFAEREIRERITTLPSDRTVAQTLSDLDASIRSANGPVVSEQVKRLKRFVAAASRKPEDRAAYRSLIARYQLFAEHLKLHGSTKKSLYRTLLQLAYDEPLSYADYCQIEDSVAGGPGWALHTVLLNTRINVIPYILAAEAGPDRSDVLMDSLQSCQWGPAHLLDFLDQDIDAILPRHRKTQLDFALRYLSARDESARQVLIDRGYLSALLDRAFPGDQRPQQSRLESILKFVYGHTLSRAQITEVFEQPALAPTRAVEAAVAALAPPKARRFIEESASYARLSRAGYAEEAALLRSSSRRRRRAEPQHRPPLIPNRTKIAAAVLLALAIAAVAVLTGLV
jgi:hypothetical protein